MSENRVCGWCRVPLVESVRADARYCSKGCRQASWRFGVRRCELEATARPMRFAYADPPYPGLANYYPERCEVDHVSLLQRLDASYPDGWALSTSAVALAGVLRLCPQGVRVCAWFKNPRKGSGWEPLIVRGGRHLSSEASCDALVYGGRYQAFPGALIGMKPPQFAVWMFQQLGARSGDVLDDLYRGSGAVALAWLRYSSRQDSVDVSFAAGADMSRGTCGDVSRPGGSDLFLTGGVP